MLSWDVSHAVIYLQYSWRFASKQNTAARRCAGRFLFHSLVLVASLSVRPSGRPQIEAMVPFAFPNPTPPSERRRVRNANSLLFSVMGGRTTNVLSDRNTGGGGGNGNRNGSNPGPAAPPATARRRASIGGGGGRSHGSGGGGGGVGGQTHSPNLEEQLYAGLGSLLEVSKAERTAVFSSALYKSMC